MKFTKITIIIISIVITILGVVFILNINNKDQESLSDTDINIEKNSAGNRTVFNTNTKEIPVNGTENNSEVVATENKTEVNTVEYKEGFEEIENNKINKILFDWNTTKDPELLKQAVFMSRSADNETILESWRLFMSSNSSELIKTIYRSDNIQQTKNDVLLIFQWYIELSGEFEKLSNTKKQEILKQYNQLK